MTEQDRGPWRWSIDVGGFSDFLVDRESATKFRLAYLQRLESDEWWESPVEVVYLDFSRVKTLSPTWVNELFGHYAETRSVQAVRWRMRLENISPVKEAIIVKELAYMEGAVELGDASAAGEGEL